MYEEETNVRFFYPTSELAQFELSSVSMIDYSWASKRIYEKIVSWLFQTIFAVGFLCLWISTLRHQWIDRTSVAILALVIIAVFSIAFVSSSQPSDSPYKPKHKFFADSARVYTGIGRGGHSSFGAEEIKQLILERGLFDARPVLLVTVEFKPFEPPFPGGRSKETFGILFADDSELSFLRDWAKRNHVTLAESPVDES